MTILRDERIGGQRLLLGDCLDVMPLLGRFDAVVTDPPYGIGISSDTVRHMHKKKDWDSLPVGHQHIEAMISKSEHQIIWGGNYFNLPPSRGFLIWDKKQPENFSLAMCEFAWWSRDHNAKLFSKSVLGYDKRHPTQKPVELMEWCLKWEGNATTILDPFLGSGTTLVACQRLGRAGTGIEIDPDYFEIACKRVDEATRQPDLFVDEPPVSEPQQQELL